MTFEEVRARLTPPSAERIKIVKDEIAATVMQIIRLEDDEATPHRIGARDEAGKSANTAPTPTASFSWDQINGDENWICVALADHNVLDSDGNPDAWLDLRICEHGDGRALVQGRR